ILRNNSMSSLPEVLSLVTIRSNARPLAAASADKLSGTFITTQELGSRTRNRTVWTSGAAPTSSAFLTAKGRLSVFGAELIYIPGKTAFVRTIAMESTLQPVRGRTPVAQVFMTIFL